MKLIKSKTELFVYTESRKRKSLVGHLQWIEDQRTYLFRYTREYLKTKGAIPIGPEFPLSRLTHKTGNSELFPSLQDRIPSKSNPAYEEYCEFYGIDPSETNPITLLTTLGRRGPSSFIFEPKYIVDDIETVSNFIEFREKLDLSIKDVSLAFDLNYLTLQRIEKGLSKDKNVLKLLYIYLNFPETSLRQIKISSPQLPTKTLEKLYKYYGSIQYNRE